MAESHHLAFKVGEIIGSHINPLHLDSLGSYFVLFGQGNK